MGRSKFPALFWIGNGIEVLERFAYYGLYIGFPIFATTAMAEGGLGWTKSKLGMLQTLFLVLSYSIPLISGPLADRYGFKFMLMVSYILYLPGFLFLLTTRDDLIIFAVMSLIAVGAGVFKPLIAGTVRLTSDKTNLTLGFGIFYLMVNVGAFFGPMTAGALRIRHWNWAFLASAAAVIVMLVVTMVFYKNPMEPEKDPAKRQPIAAAIGEIFQYMFKPKILVFIIIFGIFIEIPFWAFFNIVAMFVDSYVATDLLYTAFTKVLPVAFVDLFSRVDENGVHRIAGETLSHTALYIIVFQLVVTRTTEKMRSIPAVAVGILVMMLGCLGLFFSTGDLPGLMFLGIFLFAVGEMACMPRFEQYLITLLPPEKTGLGGGLLRIPVVVGALSGITMTPAYGVFEGMDSPQSIWLVVGGLLLVGFLGMAVYDKLFREAPETASAA